MPIGPYKDFNACVAAQRKKGKSEESAKKICGALQQKTEGVEKWINGVLDMPPDIPKKGSNLNQD